MGLSASQARFLQLTARKNNLEYSMQQITQERLSLADKMTLVSNEYNDAISNKKLVFSYFDSTSHQIDVTYSNYKDYMNQQLSGLTSSQQQIFLVSTSGKIVVTSHEEMEKIIEDNTTYVKKSDVEAAKTAENPTEEQKKLNDLSDYWETATVITKDDEEYYIKSQKFGLDDFVMVAKDSATVEQKLRQAGRYSEKEIQQILKSYVYGSDLNDVDLFQQAIKDGTYSFATFSNDEDSKNKLVAQNWSVVANGALTEKYDESDDAVAKAKYETESKKLENYDKKLQMEQDELEAERKALTIEMESIKKVVDDNIQNTFTTFS